MFASFLFIITIVCITQLNKHFLMPPNKNNISEIKVNDSSQKTLITSNIGKIPTDIIKLLWFRDWKLKNYESVENSINICGAILNFDLDDASVLSVKLPIEQGVDTLGLGYFPSYSSMTPVQRWQYLNWLSDITQPINIGYVFVFYYGLERHILKGYYEDAFNMILKLRKYHSDNNSFNGYSKSALLTCCLIHNRKDLFERLLKEKILEENEDYTICAKYEFNIPYNSEDIFQLHYKLQFPNKRYIKQYPKKFKDALKQEIEKKYSKPYIILKDIINQERCPKKHIMCFANVSLDQWRNKNIPIIINEQTRELFIDLFNNAHERVKTQLREERKTLKIISNHNQD